jgi:hypothetical protein
MSEQFFAQLDDNNVVITVHVVTADFIAANPDRYPGTWVETFYDEPSKNYAGVGYTYNFNTENFMPPIEPDDEQ